MGVNGKICQTVVSATVVFAISLLSVPVSAQFHSKRSTGQTNINPQAVKSAQKQVASSAATAGNIRSSVGVQMSGGDMILPDEVKEALKDNKVHIGQMQGKVVDIWGRAIHHGDGSYTESKQDNQTNTLEQITKSKNGVKLQRRMITLDEVGRPSESLIYDGRDQFKYRGMQIYDQFGRFSEEQIYDAKGTLIRRRVQQYDSAGAKLPLHSWDYVTNVPDDLKLVITQADAAPSASPTAAPAAPAASAAPAKKGAPFKRIFDSKKK